MIQKRKKNYWSDEESLKLEKALELYKKNGRKALNRLKKYLALHRNENDSAGSVKTAEILPKERETR